MIRLPTRPLTAAELAKAVASLRTVGGVYDFIADAVEHQEAPMGDTIRDRIDTATWDQLKQLGAGVGEPQEDAQ